MIAEPIEHETRSPAADVVTALGIGMLRAWSVRRAPELVEDAHAPLVSAASAADATVSELRESALPPPQADAA